MISLFGIQLFISQKFNGLWIKIESEPFTSSEYNSNFNKLDLEISISDRTNYKKNKVFKLSNLFSGSPKLDCHLTKNLEINYKNNKVFKYGNFISSNFEAAYHNLFLPNSHLIEDLNDTISMAKFDIIRSSPSFKSAAIDANFLTNAAN